MAEQCGSGQRGDRVEAALSAAQLVSFARDGYLLVRGFYDAQAMAELRRFTDEVASMPEQPGRHMVYYEDHRQRPDERVLSRIENFCPYHAGFDALLRGGRILHSVAQLFGEPAVLFKEKINFKMPGSDGFRAHQDVQAGWDVFAPLHITLLISIDPANVANGCLEVAPAQHRRGLLGEMWKPLSEDIDGVHYESLPTEPGDAVFFDSYLPHRSQPNRTDAPRRILYVTYNAAAAGDHRARYYSDKRAGFPPDCERQPGSSYAFRV